MSVNADINTLNGTFDPMASYNKFCSAYH